VQLGENKRITLAGMAKGTRMIHPRLATLLCVITTDLAIEQRLLQQALQHSVERSLGRLNLDGDSSPNDSVLILANGTADVPAVADGSRELAAFQEALDALCADLSQQIVRDAAGSGKILSVRVRGAANEEMARQVADSIACSRAVRSVARRDRADWGSILAAIGASGAELRPELLGIQLGGIVVLQEGQVTPHDPAAIMQACSVAEIELTIDLNAGPAELTIWTCTWHDE
jgi:glutamate N-acetyltransferase/amino-acid N-acetyltransferase